MPTQGRYRELTSTSNCTEYQARRLNIRERMEDGNTRAVSTLNGTLATTRWLVAILENHQQKDGSIVIPHDSVFRYGSWLGILFFVVFGWTNRDCRLTTLFMCVRC